MVPQPKRVAVIGAGVSGLTSARHLRKYGVDVVVFERSKKPGGNWVFDERQPLEPEYPAERPSIADFVSEDVSTPALKNHKQNGTGKRAFSEEEEELNFAPPGPAYSGLTNNITTRLQELKDFPWKKGTPDYVNVRQKEEYLASYAKHFGINSIIRYSTRVENIQKIGQKWQVRSTTLIVQGPEKGKKLHSIEEFDAVVVASGHYHASKVPDIPGLKEWKRTWPDQVQHSKRYRHPEEFRDQNVFLVGGGTSSTDIARESIPIAKHVYQSSRGGLFDLPPAFLPTGLDRVGGIASFSPPRPSAKSGSVTLVDGTVLENIDRVVVATGYHFTVPFLPTLHSDFTRPEDADDNVLVTDGTMLHNLHKDIFYIPDPTLAFVGVPFYTATYTFFEFQAIAVAAVLSGKASLPAESELRAEYRDRVREKGIGRTFHSLRENEKAYVDVLVEWLNRDAEKSGAEKVEGHSEEWIREEKVKMIKFRAFLQEKEAAIRREVDGGDFGKLGQERLEFSVNEVR